MTPTRHACQEDKGLPGGSVGQESSCNAGGRGDAGVSPGSGRSPGGGNGSPLQYPCLKNPMDGGAWRATVHGVTMGTRLSAAHTWDEERGGGTGCGSIFKAGCLTGLCEHLALPHVRAWLKQLHSTLNIFKTASFISFYKYLFQNNVCLWGSSGKLNDIS